MNNETDERAAKTKPILSAASVVIAGGNVVRQILAGIAAALGIRVSRIPKPADLIDMSTHLALDRTYWAAQRTLMGWIRTALAMISFGFTIGKVGQTLQEIEVRGLQGMRMIGIDTIAYFLVILGTVALLAAALQFSRRVYELTKDGLQPRPSIEFSVALVLGLIGFVAFSTLVLNV